MSSRLGATLREAIELAEFLRDMGYRPQQVQDFIPTPETVSTCTYCTGINPLTGDKMFTEKSSAWKKVQRALLRYWLPQNAAIVRAVLRRAGRDDLIGFGRHALARPEEEKISIKPKGNYKTHSFSSRPASKAKENRR